jgi:hypothetical protein
MHSPCYTYVPSFDKFCLFFDQKFWENFEFMFCSLFFGIFFVKPHKIEKKDYDLHKQNWIIILIYIISQLLQIIQKNIQFHLVRFTMER